MICGFKLIHGGQISSTDVSDVCFNLSVGKPNRFARIATCCQRFLPCHIVRSYFVLNHITCNKVLYCARMTAIKIALPVHLHRPP